MTVLNYDNQNTYYNELLKLNVCYWTQTCVSPDSLKHPNPDGLASPFTTEYLDQARKILRTQSI